MRWIFLLSITFVIVRCGPGLCPFGGCDVESSPTLGVFSRAALFNDGVLTLAEVPGGEGDIYVGGQFTYHQQGRAPYLVRLNSDGTIDTTFNVSGDGFNNDVYLIAVQTDGNLYAVGTFTSFGSVAVRHIARLFPDGSLDTSFVPDTTGFDSNNPGFLRVSTGGDGHIYVGGSFNTYGTTGTRGLIRLDDDGSLDTSFYFGNRFNGITGDLLFADNGEVLVGGSFTSFGPTAVTRLARLRTDGSLLTNFSPAGGPNNGLSEMAYAVDGSGEFYIGGSFTSFGGLNRALVARLRTDGTLVTNFDFSESSAALVSTLAESPDQDVYLGVFSGAGRVFRSSNDGTVDSTFFARFSNSNFLFAEKFTTSGHYVGGIFNALNSRGAFNLVRLNEDGSQDTQFLGDVGGFTQQVTAVTFAPNGDHYLGGSFTVYRGTSVGSFVRMRTDGSVDTSFVSATAGAPFSTIILSDGSLVVAGSFTAPNPRVARLHSDGSNDTAFEPGGGFNQQVEAIALAADGTDDIYAAGFFTTFNSVGSGRVVRLDSSGSIDTAFNVGVGFDQPARALLIYTDGSGDILVTGSFSTYQGVGAPGIARLNSDGSLDTHFNPGAGVDAPINVSKFAPDGSQDIYIAGSFSSYGGTAAGAMARINSNGALDTHFSVGSGFLGSVSALAFDQNNRIYAVGLFSSYGGNEARGVVRLFSDGSIDTSFEVSNSFRSDAVVGGANSIHIASDGNIFFGGPFTSYKEQAYMHWLRTDSNGNPN